MVLIRLADNAVDWQVSKVGGKGRKEDGREEIVSDGGWQKSQWAISSLFAKKHFWQKISQVLSRIAHQMIAFQSQANLLQ